MDPELILFGLSGGELIKAAKKIGLRAANEVFSDRTYQLDGTLTARTDKNALITCQETAARQAMRMVKEGKVKTVQGVDIPVKADTICIHGDGEKALDFARYIKETLSKEGIALTKVSEFIL